MCHTGHHETSSPSWRGCGSHWITVLPVFGISGIWFVSSLQVTPCFRVFLGIVPLEPVSGPGESGPSRSELVMLSCVVGDW